jgi:hypothetical protein
MLLRVGIDKGTDGEYAPIFEDGSFEFIPISRGKTYNGPGRTYEDKISKKGKSLSDYLRSAIKKRIIHDDPEFESLTYGEDGIAKGRYIRRLRAEDLLVFYAGLKPFENSARENGLYIVGYFTIERIIDFNNLQPGEMDICARNAHIVEGTTRNLVVVKGVKGRSRLLDHAILISQECRDRAGRTNLHVSDEMEHRLGVHGSIQRSIPPRFIVGEEHLTNLRNLIGL